MAKVDLVSADFEVDIIDIQIIELYSYKSYEDQQEESTLSLSALVVSNFLREMALSKE